MKAKNHGAYIDGQLDGDQGTLFGFLSLQNVATLAPFLVKSFPFSKHYIFVLNSCIFDNT
jgi:hypothetical protein